MVPFGWFPLGLAMTLERNYWSALQCLVGLSALAFFGLYFGYQSTLRFYTSPPSSVGKRAVRSTRRPLGQRLIDLSLPMMDVKSSAIALSAFLNCARHPVIMGALIPVVMMGVFFFVFRSMFNDPESGILASFMVELMPAAIVMLPFIGVINLFTNMFGLDIGGFRAFVLLPVPRWKYLFGNNAMLCTVIVSIATIMILLGNFLIPMGYTKIMISALQTLQLAFTFCIIGNFVSIYFPYHVDMRGTRPTFKQQMILLTVGFAVMFLLGMVSIPIGIAMLIDGALKLAWGYEGISVGVLVSIAMLISTALIYKISLPKMGSLLQEQEMIILNKLMKMKT